MAIPDALAEVMNHVGGTELTNKSAPKAIGHETDFVKEQVVLALVKEPGLQSAGEIRVDATDDEIVLAAVWDSEAQRELAEHVAGSLAVGRTVRSERAG